MSSEVEQIKERLGVAEIVGEYVKLEKSGVNYKALCPFHNEKTPSFTVNTERNFWYCFGCQEGGDIFTFVQKIEGLEFRDVLERFAERANVELPKFNSVKYKQKRSQRQEVLEILELTTKIYQRLLIKGKKSKELLEYLKERGLTGELIKDFRIGYSPDSWRAIVEYLSKKNYKLENIKKAGLIIHKQGGDLSNVASYYDRFRDRIMFPIININGKVIGYSARVIPGGDDKTAKYINSPQSEIYDKSKVLYGLYQAKQAIRSSGYAIIVEGQMDVVLSHRAGIKNIVAASGTALTDIQVKILKRYTDKIKLSFDMDGAGQKATKKSIQICLQNDMQVKIILLPNGIKDAGELVLKDEQAWRTAIEKAVPVMEYYFKTTFEKYNPDDIQDRKIIVKELLNIIKNIADPIEQAYWIKKLSIKTQTDESLLTNLTEKAKLNSRDEIQKKQTESINESKVVSMEKASQNKKDESRQERLECRLIGLIGLFSAELKDEIVELMKFNFLSTDVLRIIEKGDALKGYDRKVNECISKLLYQDDNGELTEADINPKKEWLIVIKELKDIRKTQKIKQIEILLNQAEENGDEEVINKLMSKLKQILP